MAGAVPMALRPQHGAFVKYHLCLATYFASLLKTFSKQNRFQWTSDWDDCKAQRVSEVPNIICNTSNCSSALKRNGVVRTASLNSPFRISPMSDVRFEASSPVLCGVLLSLRSEPPWSA